MGKSNYKVEFSVRLKDCITVSAYNYDDAVLKCISQAKKMYKDCKDIWIGETKKENDNN